jgi:hypothetical protein
VSRDSITDYTFTSDESRVLRLAVSTFIVDTCRTITELNKIKCANMAAALETEVKAAERVLQMFPNNGVI